MKKKDIEERLIRISGGNLVTIADVCKWSGRSRGWVKAHILNGLKYIQVGTSIFYLAADVAEKIAMVAVA